MEKRTKKYLVMAHLGAIASIGIFLAWLFVWPDFFQGLMIGMLLIPLLMAPRKGMRDEYIESLWNAGTSWAFITLVVTFIFAPFLKGLWEGMANIPGNSGWLDEASGYLSIVAFYVAFHAKWLATR